LQLRAPAAADCRLAALTLVDARDGAFQPFARTIASSSRRCEDL
jgi:hypothetical protein